MNSFSSLNNDVTKQWDLETLNNETIERETLLSSISINTTTEQDDTAQNIIVPNHRTASVSRVSISADAAATLSFHDINYFIGDKIEPSKHRLNFPSRSCLKSQEYKQILFNISGIFSNGMNAILGPTGCGKSSLLDILADRKDQHGLSGRILVDGLPRHPSFKYIVGYVVQEDIFTGTLTVRENLLFSANLRLPKTVSTLEKNARVLRIITELGLESCADTRMGTDFLRGVSGGEKKRTCIGMELVLSPKILFLDEPTTGLDASTANNVMSYLKKLSDEGRTIVFSIHQPRYSIFKLFDSVIFMCKGECVYHGPINNIETYFSTLGYQCKLHDNPTDFVLDILIDAHRTPETLTKLNDAYKQSSMHIDVLARAQQEDNTENQELFQSTIVVEAAQALRTEIFYVSQRTLRNALRNPAMALAQVVVSIMIGFLVGLVFYDLKKTTDPGIQDRLGTIFFIVVNQIFSSMSAIEPLLQERVLFLHEYASGYYRIQTFFIAKMVCDLFPMRAIPSVLFSVIAYFMTGLARTSGQFFVFLVTIFMACVFGSATCFFISTLTTTFSVALIIVVLIYVGMMVFSGFLIKLTSMFNWLSWIQWISAFRYASNVLTINEFQGLKLCLPNQTDVCPVMGEDVLNDRGIDHGTAWDLWKNFFALTMMTTIVFVLAYIRLLRIKKTK
ncbi:unnamed protein product [Rotaria socialis]|uniref:ABC transporter domain-containing protein n=1 Tax=Rotaria socialis TaxID=392032 RepID=A0A817XAE8_9BILA|nr:unnamed protein product [Rotaria socialis]CAF3541910.1 unnamed protein product [Rotaria socialis]